MRTGGLRGDFEAYLRCGSALGAKARSCKRKGSGREKCAAADRRHDTRSVIATYYVIATTASSYNDAYLGQQLALPKSELALPLIESKQSSIEGAGFTLNVILRGILQTTAQHPVRYAALQCICRIDDQ